MAVFKSQLLFSGPVSLPEWLWFLLRVQFYDQLFPDILRYAFPFWQCDESAFFLAFIPLEPVDLWVFTPELFNQGSVA